MNGGLSRATEEEKERKRRGEERKGEALLPFYDGLMEFGVFSVLFS